MRKIYPFISILCLTSFFALGQTNFRPGYIIKNSNDTVFGEIDNRGSFKNSKKCVFRRNQYEEPTKYLPHEIKAYRFIDGKYYVSAFLKEQSKIDGKYDITYLSDNQKNTNNVFLEYLINGIVDVYFYRNEIEDFYFVQKENSELYRLKNDDKEITVNGATYQKASNEYIGVLKYIFKDSPNTVKKVDNTIMTHKSLIDISKNYHENVCSGEECIVFEKKVVPVKFTTGIVLAERISSISYKIDNYNFSYDTENNIAFGFEISGSLNFINERISLKLETLFNKHYYYSSYSEQLAYANYYYKSYIDYSSLLGSLTLNYSFPKGKIRPVFYLGGSADLMLKNNSKVTVSNYNNSNVTLLSEQIFSPYSDSYGGYIIGLGFDFHFFENYIPFLKFDYSYLNGPGLVKNITNIKMAAGVKF